MIKKREGIVIINKDYLLFFLIAVDILFLPYLPFFSVSFSVFLIVLWLFFNYTKFNNDYEFRLFMIMCLLIIMSSMISIIYDRTLRIETTFITTILRMFQYIICFGYYFYFKSFFMKYNVDIKNIIFIAIVYIAIFAFLFQLFPDTYANIKIMINPADNHTRRYLSNSVLYRFNYLWTDPNNVSYLIAGVNIWYMKNENNKIKKTVALILSIYIVFCTVSNGGLIILFLMLMFYFFLNVFNMLKKRKVKKKAIIFFIISCVIILLVIYNTNILQYIYNKYIIEFSNRVLFYTKNTLKI